jgi:curved DNA-binding protein CbpA
MEEDRSQESIEFGAQEIRALDFLYELAQAGDYYAMFGVAPHASTASIRKSFYEMSRQWHPDRFYRKKLGEHAQRVEFVFVAITQAYHILTDPARREAYDASYKRADVRGTIQRGPAPTVVTDRRDGTVHEVSWFIAPDGSARSSSDASPPGVGARASSVATSTSEPGSPPSAASAGQASPPPQMRPSNFVIPGVDKLRKQLAGQISKARQYYVEALRDAQEGNYVKAAASLYLATRYDPGNAEYKTLLEDYQTQGKTQMARAAIHIAENAESYHDLRTAIAAYEKACSYDPPLALPFYRLALLRLRDNEDDREAVRLLRQSAEKEPGNIRYRMDYAACLRRQNMEAQARREYMAILRLQPNHAEAKEALKKVKA